MTLQRCSTSLMKQGWNRELAKYLTAKQTNKQKAIMKIERTPHSTLLVETQLEAIFNVLRSPKDFFRTRNCSPMINFRGKRKESKSTCSYKLLGLYEKKSKLMRWF